MQHTVTPSPQEQHLASAVLETKDIDLVTDPEMYQVIYELSTQYGTQLERLNSYSRHVLRASLSLYLCWLYKLTEQQAPVPETLIEDAIEQADPDCWGNGEIDQYISDIAMLPPHDIEHLLGVLSNPLSLSLVDAV